MVRTDWVVRIFEQRDAQAVKGMWKEGFLEMAWDFTRCAARRRSCVASCSVPTEIVSLLRQDFGAPHSVRSGDAGAAAVALSAQALPRASAQKRVVPSTPSLTVVLDVGNQTNSPQPIRPVATGIALAGVTRAAVALVRREGRDKVAMGAAIAGAGLGALALFHLQARRMITKMCVAAALQSDALCCAGCDETRGHDRRGGRPCALACKSLVASRPAGTRTVPLQVRPSLQRPRRRHVRHREDVGQGAGADVLRGGGPCQRRCRRIHCCCTRRGKGHGSQPDAPGLEGTVRAGRLFCARGDCARVLTLVDPFFRWLRCCGCCAQRRKTPAR